MDESDHPPGDATTGDYPVGDYTVGAVARLAGVSVRTLHHYDQTGLLTPAGRSAAGYRLYSLALHMRISLTPEEQFEIFGTGKVGGEWAEEAERRWGDTQAWQQSQRRATTYTREHWLEIQAEATG